MRRGRASLLDEAHELVSLAQQSEHALARQMHFTDLALLSQDEAAIARILRENNRFNDTPGQAGGGRARPSRALVEQIRSSQDEAMARRGRHGQRDPRRQARRCHGRAAAPPGAARRRDHGARRPARRGAAGPDDAAARQRRRRQPPLADPDRRLRRERGAARAGSAASSSRGRSSCPCARRRASSTDVAAGDFGGTHRRCPIATSSARSPTG